MTKKHRVLTHEQYYLRRYEKEELALRVAEKLAMPKRFISSGSVFLASSYSPPVSIKDGIRPLKKV